MSFFAGFLAPAAFVGLIALPVVVLLYFLKLKRESQVVSSTLLWKRSMEEMRVNSPFQKLRRNLLLLLQLLILALGVLALARPVMKLAAAHNRRLIVLIDSSASMRTTDAAGGSRLEEAKRKASSLADDLSRGEEMAVISFDRRASVASPFTESRAQLRSAIDSIEPSDAVTDLAAGMRIADGLARARGSASESEIIIISDGRVGGMEDFTRFPGGEGLRRMRADSYTGEAPVRFVSIGSRESDNAGIVALEARRRTSIEGGVEVFCRVANHGTRPLRCPLELRVGGELCDAKEVSVPPEAETTAVFESLTWREGMLELRLAVKDSFEADNVARAQLSDLRDVKALLVTDGSFFLEKGLESLAVSGVTTDVMKPKAFAEMEAATPDRLLAYDAIVMDGVVPKLLKEGNYLFFDAYPALKDLARTGGEVANPQVLDWDPAHPANRFANYGPLLVEKAPEVRWPRRAVPIVAGSAGPLIAAIAEERMNCVIVAFDIYNSNWPLRRSFPIFLANSVRWLAAGSPRRASANLRTGDVITVYPTGKAGFMTIEDPSGRKHRVECSAEASSYFSATDLAGVYVGRAGGDRFQWAVNLLSGAESDNAAAESFQMGAEGKVSAASLPRNRETWKWLVLAAFAVLCLEWWVYNRRMYF